VSLEPTTDHTVVTREIIPKAVKAHAWARIEPRRHLFLGFDSPQTKRLERQVGSHLNQTIIKGTAHMRYYAAMADDFESDHLFFFVSLPPALLSFFFLLG
jgi:hypothetical protein